MWTIALIIYLIGVPVAFVIGCMLRRSADAKRTMQD